MTADQMARGSNYGDIITDEEAITGGAHQYLRYIEDGGPYTEDTSASNYITPPELNWAVWSSFIHGAKASSISITLSPVRRSRTTILRIPTYQTVQPGQTVSMYTQVQNTDALVKQMAPVLNSPTALGYVTVNNAGYEDGTVVSHIQRHRDHGEGRQWAVLCLR